MRKSFLIFLSVISTVTCLFSQDESTSAPILNPFSLKGDNIGAFANSVNLLTGELAVPLNLVSIPGRAGIGINISVNYNSTNIENIVNLWNQDSPTGTLGLGWSLQTPLIFVDNKQTGTREDDEFYLSEGGASIKMICVGNSSGVRTYKTKSFSNWIIKFTAGVERWEITKDDGTKYAYGGEPGGNSAHSEQLFSRQSEQSKLTG